MSAENLARSREGAKETPQASDLKPLTAATLRRMGRARRTWKRDAAVVEKAVDGVQGLGLFEGQSAFAHFMGGCLSTLETYGSIDRDQFVHLLNQAGSFGRRSNQSQAISA